MEDDDLIALDGADPMNKHTARRKRRRAKLRLNHVGAVRPHKRKTGRTGSIKEKKNYGKGETFIHKHPNPPWQSRVDLPKR